MSTGRITWRRQRLHSRSSAVRRSAVARIPRLVRTNRTRPAIDSASRRSSPRSIRASATSRMRSAPGPSVEQAGDVPGKGGLERPARGHRVEWEGSPVSSMARSPPSAWPSPVPSSDARRPSRRSIPFRMLSSVLVTSASRPTSTPTAYSSAPLRMSSASSVGVADDHPALRLGRLGQATLVDQEGGLLLGPGDDPLGFVLCLLDDPLALGVDAFGRADLFGDGDAQLIDEAEGRVLVDHDVRRQRQLLAVGDQRFEALDEEDDVDRSALQAGEARWRRLTTSIARGCLGQRLPSALARASLAATGIIPDTSPPNPAISLTRLELT